MYNILILWQNQEIYFMKETYLTSLRKNQSLWAFGREKCIKKEKRGLAGTLDIFIKKRSKSPEYYYHL
jgi:hypothetical protein